MAERAGARSADDLLGRLAPDDVERRYVGGLETEVTAVELERRSETAGCFRTERDGVESSDVLGMAVHAQDEESAARRDEDRVVDDGDTIHVFAVRAGEQDIAAVEVVGAGFHRAAPQQLRGWSLRQCPPKLSRDLRRHGGHTCPDVAGLTHGVVEAINVTILACYAEFFTRCVQSATFDNQIAIADLARSRSAATRAL